MLGLSNSFWNTASWSSAFLLAFQAFETFSFRSSFPLCSTRDWQQSRFRFHMWYEEGPQLCLTVFAQILDEGRSCCLWWVFVVSPDGFSHVLPKCLNLFLSALWTTSTRCSAVTIPWVNSCVFVTLEAVGAGGRCPEQWVLTHVKHVNPGAAAETAHRVSPRSLQLRLRPTSGKSSGYSAGEGWTWMGRLPKHPGSREDTVL